MSSIGNQIFNSTLQNEIVSKRQQKKFQQMLKQIEASENPDSKSHKRRKQTNQKHIDPQARKMIKMQSHESEGKIKQTSSSLRQKSEQQLKSQQKIIKRELKDLHDVYNKNYGIFQNNSQTNQYADDLSDYMVNYTYMQKSKISQKSFQDWNKLQTIGGKKIILKTNSFDNQIMTKINERFLVQKKKVQQLFSKNSKQFFQKILADQLAL